MRTRARALGLRRGARRPTGDAGASIGLYVHALKAARLRQLRARVVRPLLRRRFPRPTASPLSRFHPPEGATALWRSSAFSGPFVDGSSIDVLGEAHPYPPRDWTLPGATRLRRFHLHYGEDVLSWARRGEGARAAAAASDWIARNPPRRSDAWHPYVVATRTGNWIAAAALEPEVAGRDFVQSLNEQLLYLARNIEHDVLGNHVIRDARALVLGGVALGDRDMRDVGLELLRCEVAEQILPDGGHYERSPVYHSVVMRDLLEIRAALASSEFDDALDRMTAFACALARPDGGPALFNDGSLDLSPDLGLPVEPAGLAVFPETGYVVVREGPLWLAFDCGPPSPPFLPAHAHADVLSFQLWRNGEPVVVDPGTYTYEPGAERNHFRSTAAHSTVSVDGRDQFRLWGAFRSGPLPRVTLLEATDRTLAARVDYDQIAHVRRLRWSSDELEVEDEVHGRGAHELTVTVPLARPSAAVAQTGTAREFAVRHGWLSEHLYRRREIPVLKWETQRRLPTELVWRVAMLGP